MNTTRKIIAHRLFFFGLCVRFTNSYSDFCSVFFENQAKKMTDYSLIPTFLTSKIENRRIKSRITIKGLMGAAHIKNYLTLL